MRDLKYVSPLLVGAVLLAGCIEDFQLAETEQPIIDYGTAPLHLTWMNASHNTYVTENTGPGDITWHFLPNNSTMHIEIDIRDTNAGYPTLSGNWIVTHNDGDAPTIKCGGAGAYSLSWCLYTLQYYHVTHPGHPFISVFIDKKQNWENNNQNSSSRSPWRFDNLISTYFPDSALFTPLNFRYWWTLSGLSVRSAALNYGWPAHNELAGKLMFIFTSDPGCDGNNRLEQYVDNRGWNAKAFIAPNGNGSSYVTSMPQCFDTASTEWAAIYGFEWVDANNDGECDSSACYYLRTAHDRHFLTRVYDIDDPAEADKASERPFGTGTYGHANWIAVDAPWLRNWSDGNGRSSPGNHPDGVYPW